MRSLLRRLGAALRAVLPDSVDVHFYAGALLVALGAGGYSRPAGLIAFGTALLVMVYRRPE